MTIPILDLKPEVTALKQQYMDAFERVLDSTQFILGPEVAAFEQEAADALGVEHSIGVNSGTDALVIALRALGIGPGDEVICPSFTFFATAESISQVGATPVFVDIEPDTMNAAPDAIGTAATERTKAIMPVHLFGHGADMGAIVDMAAERDLKVVEDCAQSWGATTPGGTTGAIGDVGAFSFFPSKNLGAFGDGGLIATDNAEIAAEARKLRFHGCKIKYQNEAFGYNSRLDAMQAAFLRIKLRHIDEWTEARRTAAEAYTKALATVEGIVTPAERPGYRHVYHQYTVRIQGANRDVVQGHMQDAGVQTMVYYPTPVHRLPVYNQSTPMPVTDAAAEQVLSLPIGPWLDPLDQNAVIESLIRAVS